MGTKCQYCECDHNETGPCPTQEQIDNYADYDDEECGQCDGSGYWYHCIDGCCIDPEEGCNLCARRCDFCNPFKPTPEQAKERAELGKILTDALEQSSETKPK